MTPSYDKSYYYMLINDSYYGGLLRVHKKFKEVHKYYLYGIYDT